MDERVVAVAAADTFRGVHVVDVLEGSVVYWGSQGTRFVSAERQGRLTLPEALEAARVKYHEPIELTSTRPVSARMTWPYGAEE